MGTERGNIPNETIKSRARSRPSASSAIKVLPFKQYRRDESSSSRKQRRRVGVALKGYALLPKVVFGVKFNDGIEVVRCRLSRLSNKTRR
jgi:hypothetical protein